VTLAIIDSGGANIGSVIHALNRLGAESVFTADAATIRAADRVLLPGVGAAGAAMTRLRETGLVEVIRELRQPVLGICLGMQLLFERSEEDDTACLGIVTGTLTKMKSSQDIRVPHMGWNTISVSRDDPLLAGLPDIAWYYFVHSYCAPLSGATLATCLHGGPFAAIVRQGNFYGAQFHPERSAKSGARLLANFLALP
jgi:glutamine amidotransferase